MRTDLRFYFFAQICSNSFHDRSSNVWYNGVQRFKRREETLYEFIRGNVQYIQTEYIVVENNGIGYRILTPNSYSYTNYIGQEVTIYTYTYVREDIFALYGFGSREEKLLFTKLLSVTGIGPKGALAILASGEPQQVVQAIENEDEAFLIKFPGVGKKTSRQMILDLKGKLQDVLPEYFPNLFNPDEKEAKEPQHEKFDEAILALLALGYSEREIKKISPQLKKENLSTDQYIKKGLQLLLKS